MVDLVSCTANLTKKQRYATEKKKSSFGLKNAALCTLISGLPATYVHLTLYYQAKFKDYCKLISFDFICLSRFKSSIIIKCKQISTFKLTTLRAVTNMENKKLEDSIRNEVYRIFFFYLIEKLNLQKFVQNRSLKSLCGLYLKQICRLNLCGGNTWRGLFCIITFKLYCHLFSTNVNQTFSSPFCREKSNYKKQK